MLHETKAYKTNTEKSSVGKKPVLSYKESTEITGLNEELLRSALNLQNLFSGFDVEPAAFDKYANESRSSSSRFVLGSTCPLVSP